MRGFLRTTPSSTASSRSWRRRNHSGRSSPEGSRTAARPSEHDQLIAELRRCRTLATLKEVKSCENDLNTGVLEELAETFGKDAFGCDMEEAKARNLGVFLVKTLDNAGRRIEEVRGFDEPLCNTGKLPRGVTTAPGRVVEGKNVVPVVLDGGDRIFVKLGGALEFTPRELDASVDAMKVASVLGREVVPVLNVDYENQLLATKGVEGVELETDYTALAAQELAGMLVFEAVTGFGDRNPGNVLYRQGTIVELDFDYPPNYGVKGPGIDVYREGYPLDITLFNGAVIELVTRLKDPKAGIEAAEQDVPGIRRAVAERLVEALVKQETITGAAPRIMEQKPGVVEKRLSAIAMLFGFDPKDIKQEAEDIKSKESALEFGLETSVHLGDVVSKASAKLTKKTPRHYIRKGMPPFAEEEGRTTRESIEAGRRGK